MWQQQVPSHADTVSDFVEFAAMWLEDRRYTLNIDADMTAWARAMASAPGMALVNPTFDPRWSPLSPANSFWLDIRAGSRTVAMIAARLFVTDDYLELMRSTRLWYDRPSARLPIEVHEGTPAASATRAASGSTQSTASGASPSSCRISCARSAIANGMSIGRPAPPCAASARAASRYGLTARPTSCPAMRDTFPSPGTPTDCSWFI
jgi:hypothetical protein